MEGLSLDPGTGLRFYREFMRINRSVGLGDKRIVYQYSAFIYHVIKRRLFRRIG